MRYQNNLEKLKECHDVLLEQGRDLKPDAT